MIDYFHITDKKENLLFSNLPREFHFQIAKASSRASCFFCSIQGRSRSHIIFSNQEIDCYLLSDDTGTSQREFRSIFDFFRNLYRKGNLNDLSQKHRVVKGLTQLKHNIVSHNTTILQEVQNYISEEKMSNTRGNLQWITDMVDSNAELAAQALLRILKTAKLLRTDIEVYELLLNEQPVLQLEWHKLHNVILQTLNAFWLDFQTKRIRVNIGTSHHSVFIDYRTVSVIFCHFHDNAVKYILKNSELSIHFQVQENYLELQITMKSLKIHNHELETIFREGVSGEESKRAGISGTGLGLNVIKRLCNLNNIEFHLHPNTHPEESVISEARVYDFNKFIFKFKKFK